MGWYAPQAWLPRGTFPRVLGACSTVKLSAPCQVCQSCGGHARPANGASFQATILSTSTMHGTRLVPSILTQCHNWPSSMRVALSGRALRGNLLANSALCLEGEHPAADGGSTLRRTGCLCGEVGSATIWQSCQVEAWVVCVIHPDICRRGDCQ